MARDRILMDGTDSEPGGPAPGVSPILVGVLGIVVGVLGAIILTGGGPTEAAPDDDVGAEPGLETAGTSTTTTTVPIRDDPPLNELVPGLRDTLIASGIDTAGMPTVDIWPSIARRPNTVPLPRGELESDVTNRWLSIVSDQRYGDDRTLWVGNEAYVEPVSTGVIDAIWDASISGRLAWLEQVGDAAPVVRTRTFPTNESPDPGRVIAAPDVTRVLWYTREGLTVEVSDPEPRLVTIRPDGSRVEGEPGVEFLAGTDLFALVRIDGDPLLVDSSLEPIAQFPDQITGCRTAEFSPLVDRLTRRVGLSCQIQNTTLLAAFEIEIIGGATPGEITNLGGQPILGLTSVSWAGGDRFIATVLPINGPAPESIVTIWDVDAHETTLLEWEGAMFAIESMSP